MPSSSFVISPVIMNPDLENRKSSKFTSCASGKGLFLGILFRKAKREGGDHGFSHGEPDQEWPVPVKPSLEENGPRPNHLILCLIAFTLFLSLLITGTITCLFTVTKLIFY